jgi:hypothetical protein
MTQYQMVPPWETPKGHYGRGTYPNGTARGGGLDITDKGTDEGTDEGIISGGSTASDYFLLGWVLMKLGRKIDNDDEV